MPLTKDRNVLLDRAKAIAESAKSAGRVNLTPAQVAEIEAILADVKKIDLDLDTAEATEKARQSDVLLAGLAQLRDGAKDLRLDGSVTPGQRQYLQLKSDDNRIAGQIAAEMRRAGGPGRKSLVPAGDAHVNITSSLTDPAALGRPLPGLLDALPTNQRSTKYDYLRQTLRDNKAALVAPGALKPTSIYNLVKVEATLQVIAHLSEPVDKYLLSDDASLTQFIQQEMLYGLRLAVENEIINGDGTAGHLVGLMHVPGVSQVTGVAGDVLASIHLGIVEVESHGFAANLAVLNPLDWALVETSTTANGEYLLAPGAPVDRVAKRVWGCPVVTTNQIAAGGAVVLDRTAVSLDTDNGVQTEWNSQASDLFDYNAVKARTEGRFNIAVYQPAAIAVTTLPPEVVASSKSK